METRKVVVVLEYDVPVVVEDPVSTVLQNLLPVETGVGMVQIHAAIEESAERILEVFKETEYKPLKRVPLEEAVEKLNAKYKNGGVEELET